MSLSAAQNASGMVSAIWRNRSSLSRNDSSARLSSVESIETPPTSTFVPRSSGMGNLLTIQLRALPRY